MNREQITIMRGFAILFIALHNYLHLEPFRLVQENEMKFDSANAQVFFYHLSTPTFSVIGDIFSFIGWCGVPLFVFLSGYGLVIKHESRICMIDIKTYIKYSYQKLLFLLLPAAVFFTIYHLLMGNVVGVIRRLFSLTFLNNLANELIGSFPSFAPTYWYFGLTFQLYIIYLICRRFQSYKILYLIAIVFLLLQLLLSPELYDAPKVLSYIRHNSFGWITFFICGMLVGREHLEKGHNSKIYSITPYLKTGGVFLLLLMFVMNVNFYAWIFMPFVAILFFISLGLILEKNTKLYRIMVWIGNLSSYIFVAHPIAMVIVQNIPLSVSLWISTLVYVTLFMCIALAYKPIHLRIIRLHRVL